MEFKFSDADKTRYNITNQQAKEIVKLYENTVKKIDKQIEHFARQPKTATTYLRIQQLNDLKSSIKNELTNIHNELNIKIPKNMLSVSEAVVENMDKINSKIGFNFANLNGNVSTDIIANVLNGTVYKKPWSFSKALWADLKKNQDDIDKIVAQGIAENKSALEIARDLEKYVDPKAKKPWDWGKVYPGSTQQIDYNAQRLARTLVSHAYQQSLITVCKPNPFVTGFRWLISNSGRVCPICLDREGKIYPKDELPLDHPNGMCTWEAVMPNMNDIADRLADWVLGKNDPEITAYARYLGHNV